MESKLTSYHFKGLGSYAGLPTGQTTQLTPDVWEGGTVTVEMPHAPTVGRVKFDAQQWRDWYGCCCSMKHVA